MVVNAARRLPVLAGLMLSLVLTGCASQGRIAYNNDEAHRAVPVGFDGFSIRAENLSDPKLAQAFSPQVTGVGRLSYLALSGGGGDGAYGAGILNGWSASGQRPTFSVVSGVSTGAIISPFAFLGPAYDPVLKEIYTNGTAASLVEAPNLVLGLFGSGLFGSRRLLDLISKYLDQDMVAAIAAEHRKGRRLFILTTNIDSQHGTVWNVGAIAASGVPGSLDLIRKIIAASASVPLAFSPILIDVQAGGRAFQEMHVDGSVTTAVFILPREFISSRNAHGLSGGDIYVLMNTSIVPKFSVVENKTLDITRASFETLTTQKTIDNLVQTYAFAKANNIGFNLTAIDPDVDVGGAESFDTKHMQRLYDIAYQQSQPGRFWMKTPPSVKLPTEQMAGR